MIDSMICRRCGKKFEPLHSKDFYCEDCHSDYISEDISDWEDEMNYGSDCDYDFSDLYEDEFEE